jgi:hypothetical protein
MAMKNSKKRMAEIVALVVSIIVFYLIFHNWDPIKAFIGNLF